MRRLMRTTESAPERTTAPFGGPPGCLLLGTPFMDRVLPPECGPRDDVASLLVGASRRSGCLRYREYNALSLAQGWLLGALAESLKGTASPCRLAGTAGSGSHLALLRQAP